MISKKFLAGIAAFISAASVQAGQIPLSTSVSLGNQLSNGQSQNVQININGLLASNGLSSDSILSGILTVTGFSAANYADDTSSTGYMQVDPVTHVYRDCKHGVCTDKVITDKVRVKDYTNEHSDPVADIMKVMVGDASGSATAADRNESYTDFGARVAEPDKTTGNAASGYNYFYHRNRDHFLSISGGLQVLLDLDDVALDDLFADGIQVLERL